MYKNDDYDWLRDKNWPNSIDDAIIQHLDNYNSQVNDFFQPLEGMVETIYNEIKCRIAEDDKTVPIEKNGYLYYEQILEGQNYWVHYRQKGEIIDVLLDENIEAQKYDFFKLGHLTIAKNSDIIGYSFDSSGDERYDIIIKNIANNEIIDASVKDVFGNFVWDDGAKGFFYLPAGQYWRSDRVMYHALGTNQEEDVLVYQEQDETFRIGMSLSSSESYIMMNISSATSNEIRYLDSKSQNFEFQIIERRKQDIIYDVTHNGDYWYILTNDMGQNFRLLKVKIGSMIADGVELIGCSNENYLTSICAYNNHLVMEYKNDGLVKISKLSFLGDVIENIKFDDQSYYAHHIFTHYHYESIRYSYSSLCAPNSIYELKMGNNILDFFPNSTSAATCSVVPVLESSRTLSTLRFCATPCMLLPEASFERSLLLKKQVMPAGFIQEDYEVQRLKIKSNDGVLIPVSIIFKKSLFKQDAANPLYLYGYGSYGISVPASFRPSIISLLDRGVVYAIAHIRGGDDLGYNWYESAKFLNKKRTFEDFLSVANGLIDLKYTSAGNIVIAGGSAGGMLIGYCINKAPWLFKAAIMHVPFVDVLNTMLDETLPLTPGEFKEWGNPKEKEYYDYIKSYSPFDCITTQDYPHLFVTSGLYDPRVTYWEPLKFVSKLQDCRTNNNLLLLKTNMSAGHAGKSGRYDYIKEIAEEFAFIITALQLG